MLLTLAELVEEEEHVADRAEGVVDGKVHLRLVLQHRLQCQLLERGVPRHCALDDGFSCPDNARIEVHLEK